MKTKYKVLDAIMGTGKSTYISLHIKANPQSRYIVVLPMLPELERYERKLKEINGLVSLHNGNGKKERFDAALDHASTILITHALFEDFLDDRSFEQISQGKWHLIMDEVITAFETVEATHVDILGMCQAGALQVREVKPGVELLQHNPMTFLYFKTARKETVSRLHKAILKDSLVKDLYRFTCDNGCQYYSFSLQEKRLSAFEEVIILTYPFKSTHLDYWFQIKGIEVEHLTLTKKKETNSLSDFTLSTHTGEYSGKSFKNLIQLLEPPVIRGKQKYGNRHEHFSATQMEKLFNPKTRDKEILKIRQEIQNSLRSLFRNGRSGMVDPKDFMFTCGKNSMLAFRNSKCGLTKDFIGEDTFVPFNVTATNKYADRHHLAYLYNVFPFPSIQQAIRAYGIDYDEDRNALYVLIQWIWRSAIRKGEKIHLYIPSKRMRKILEDWLNA